MGLVEASLINVWGWAPFPPSPPPLVAVVAFYFFFFAMN